MYHLYTFLILNMKPSHRQFHKSLLHQSGNKRISQWWSKFFFFEMKLLPICNMDLVSPPASPSAIHPPSSIWGHRWDTHTVTVMCTHSRSCTHTHAHTFVVMCTHIHKHSSCASTHKHMCTHTRTHFCSCTHTHGHVHTHIYTYTHTCGHVHTRVHMYIHTCGQTQTHTSLVWFKSSIFIIRYLFGNLMYILSLTIKNSFLLT